MVLTSQHIEFLKEKGFVQSPVQNSNYFFIEKNNKKLVLIPMMDGLFKLEFYETHPEGYSDFDKEFSKENQTLEEFVNLSIFYVDLN